jgi:hypothetical protein
MWDVRSQEKNWPKPGRYQQFRQECNNFAQDIRQLARPRQHNFAMKGNARAQTLRNLGNFA